MKVYVLIENFDSYDHSGSYIISIHTDILGAITELKTKYPFAEKVETAYHDWYAPLPRDIDDEYRRNVTIEVHELMEDET